MQIFRGLMMPIFSRMLTDIMSCLVETAVEQSEKIAQGYVTQLVLKLSISDSTTLTGRICLMAKCFDVNTKKIIFMKVS